MAIVVSGRARLARLSQVEAVALAAIDTDAASRVRVKAKCRFMGSPDDGFEFSLRLCRFRARDPTKT